MRWGLRLKIWIRLHSIHKPNLNVWNWAGKLTWRSWTFCRYSQTIIKYVYLFWSNMTYWFCSIICKSSREPNVLNQWTGVVLCYNTVRFVYDLRVSYSNLFKLFFITSLSNSLIFNCKNVSCSGNLLCITLYFNQWYSSASAGQLIHIEICVSYFCGN